MFPRAAQRRFLIPLILVSFAVATAFVNVQQVTTSSAPINSCSFVAPPVGSTDDGEPPLVACGGYYAGMRVYSSAAGRSTVFTSHSAKQANSRGVNVEAVLESGKVKRRNGYIYITLGRYEVRVESKDGAIVTVVKNK